ncbi:hypothetical protein [Erythrobacter sp.]
MTDRPVVSIRSTVRHMAAGSDILREISQADDSSRLTTGGQ